MHAVPDQLDVLAAKLFHSGVTAFLPTTLSSPMPLFEGALRRLGAWVRTEWQHGPRTGRAFPVGIHLEGPFLAHSCCGAHPPGSLIRPSLQKLTRWWQLSRHTLARITLAPELGPAAEIEAILKFCRRHSISVSLGHSGATEEQARYWFSRGIRQVTHAWNAMPFHHRNPGILGVFLDAPSAGSRPSWIEIIPDGVHVSDPVLRWTHALAPGRVFWVSDCVPSGHTTAPCSFGTLTVQADGRVSRTPQGHLAGGALTLARLCAEAFRRKALPASQAESSGAWIWDGPWAALGRSAQRSRWKKQLENARQKRAKKPD